MPVSARTPLASRGRVSRSPSTYSTGPGATITPATIGGVFTRMVAYFPSLVVENQNGGRITESGFVGSGAAVAADSWFTANGSATGIAGNWLATTWSEDQKKDIWSNGYRVFALGTCEPFPGYENQFVPDSLPKPPAPVPIDYVAYYNNDFQVGLVGPSQSAVRYSGNWISTQFQPVEGAIDEGAVKCYPANQVAFPYPNGPAISAFQSIWAYADVVNPLKEPNPQIIYEAAWDCYGFAHLDRNAGSTSRPFISLEIMFWTYNHNQSPFIGPLVETNVDLDDGRGPVWDLFMTPDSVATGGVNDRYSYGIFYLPDAYQEDSGWVNILAGLRYFSQYYVKTTGGAPANPLDVSMYQITRGWEVCSTEYSPVDFRMNDYNIIMT